MNMGVKNTLIVGYPKCKMNWAIYVRFDMLYQVISLSMNLSFRQVVLKK